MEWHRLTSYLALLIVTGCGPRQGVTPTKKLVVGSMVNPIPSARPLQAAPRVAATGASRGADAIRRRDVLQAFCEPVFVPEINDWVGCAECPAFTGSPEQGLRPEAAFMIEQEFFGSFSKAGAVEAIFSLKGCEIRSMGMGGVVFLAHEGGAWQVVSYTPGPWGDCSSADENGRTRFLCRSGSAWQGSSEESVVVRDYGQPKPLFLFDLGDDTGTACFLQPQAGVYYSGTISAVGWLDINRDGHQDVAATISFASETWKTAPSEADCQNKVELTQQRFKDTARRDFLEFLGNGTAFTPSPVTQQILDDIERRTTYRPPTSAKPTLTR